MQSQRIALVTVLAVFTIACQQTEQEVAQASTAPIESQPIAVAPSSTAPTAQSDQSATGETAVDASSAADSTDVLARLKAYSQVRLTADLGNLSANQRQLIGKLIDASQAMDELFWRQAFGDPQPLLARADEAPLRRFIQINYGPWDRLDGDRPFLTGVGPKPSGANFYPPDMTDVEFDAADLDDKTGLYSLVRRDAEGALITLPYHEVYAEPLSEAAQRLLEAADLADNQAFADYLRLRAEALITDDYQPSDMAWLDMKDNIIDVIIGAIETYEDRRYGYRAGYASYVLLKDMAWSDRLTRYATLLPELQAGLPVPDEYKRETPGSDADLNAYDVLFYAGHSNAGAKTIAINLPNDEAVQLAKGTRRLQLKNAMRAKFDRILVPIADVLIASDQRQNVSFDAFFGNTMFHEVAHGLGIKNTITASGSVRQALRETASAHEEGKADVLGLYMIERLIERGDWTEADLMDHYVTFLADIFRSTRFGASSAHGRANMVRFNYFAEQDAFVRDPETGHYRVQQAEFTKAVRGLSQRILIMQGEGDYALARRVLDEEGMVGDTLQSDLDRLAQRGIPVDIVFEQGKTVLGL